MSAAPKRRFTVEEYLARENAAEFKSEYFDGEIFAMAGASPEHNRIKDNVVGLLHGQLRSGPCRTYSSDQRIRIPNTGLFTYPDVVVICGKLERDAVDPIAAVNPRIVVEVLSPSTEAYDRGKKFEHYQTLDAFVEYVLVASDRVRVDRFVKMDDGSWRVVGHGDLESTLTFGNLPARLKLADVYEGVDFPAA
jgi:Uma2 family endonuclease